MSSCLILYFILGLNNSTPYTLLLYKFRFFPYKQSRIHLIFCFHTCHDLIIKLDSFYPTCMQISLLLPIIKKVEYCNLLFMLYVKFGLDKRLPGI